MIPNKVLVIGTPNKQQQKLLDKMIESGYDVTYETEHEIKGIEYDFILVDEITTTEKFIEYTLEQKDKDL